MSNPADKPTTDHTDLIAMARAGGQRDARDGREWDTLGFETQPEINAYFEGYREVKPT